MWHCVSADVMGFWQSKMRYRSSDELVDIAVQFATRTIPLDVLVIGETQSHMLEQRRLYVCHTGQLMQHCVWADFYSWSKFGDFHFDYECWPNATEMVQLVRSVGTYMSSCLSNSTIDMMH